MSRCLMLMGLFLLTACLSPPATAAEAEEKKEKPLRVLLVTGGATRDYQFVRTLFIREMDKKRVEPCIYMQLPADPEKAKLRVQEIPGDRLLLQFPNRHQEDEKGAKEPFLNLASYDLLVAFDFDWTQLKAEQLKLVQQWVDKQGGGLIFVAGPVNTQLLARPNQNTRDKVKPILDLLPVVLKDSRASDADRDAKSSYPLCFSAAAGDIDFLKLDDDKDAKHLQGWEQFFGKIVKDKQTKKEVAERGFYSYYPVDKVKDGATIAATFGDADARLKDKSEQPYLVTMKQGKGKVVYIGSGETWRLRQYKEEYHERFWTKLSHYAAAGSLAQRK